MPYIDGEFYSRDTHTLKPNQINPALKDLVGRMVSDENYHSAESTMQDLDWVLKTVPMTKSKYASNPVRPLQ